MRKYRLALLLPLLIPVFLAAQTDQPNILFIAIDDLNNWIGAMSKNAQVKTPNLDRLAEKGVLFTNAHTQAPLCNPSRTSVLTGLRPSTTGIYGLAPRHRQVPRFQDVVTLPQALSENGYHTIIAGKIFHGGIPVDERQIEADEWGPPGGFGPVPEDKVMQKNLDMVDHPLLDWGILPSEYDTLLSDYILASWAVDRIKQLEQEPDELPFFMGIGFHRPHVPLLVTQKWFDLYPDDAVALPPALLEDRNDIPDFAWYLHWYLPEPRLSWLIENDEWTNMVRSYLASISFVDAQIGRVIDGLESSAFKDNTIVILWSDHGYHLGEKGITGKNSLWENSTNVPLIFSGVGIPQDRICDEPVELLDLYPTILDLIGVELIETLEGISLLPQLNDVSIPRRNPAVTTHNPGNHSVRSRNWRYIHYANGTEELYNLKRDPNEWNNLAPNRDYNYKLEELKKWLPKQDAPLAPGSEYRILEKIGNDWYWEGKAIDYELLVD